VVFGQGGIGEVLEQPGLGGLGDVGLYQLHAGSTGRGIRASTSVTDGDVLRLRVVISPSSRRRRGPTLRQWVSVEGDDSRKPAFQPSGPATPSGSSMPTITSGQ